MAFKLQLDIRGKNGELLASTTSEAGPGSSATPGRRLTKADSGLPAGWVPATVKAWDSRNGISKSEPATTEPASELATKLAGKLLLGDEVPAGIKKLLLRLLTRG
jgi:hypothetical protein